MFITQSDSDVFSQPSLGLQSLSSRAAAAAAAAPAPAAAPAATIFGRIGGYHRRRPRRHRLQPSWN
jgi:hypothetical protein